MSRAVRIVVGLVVLAAVVGGAVLIYIYVSGGSGEATAPITAPTLEPDPATANPTSADAVVAADMAADGQLFEIVPEESEVRFILNEVLRGQPNTVVGRTDQVAGQVFVNFEQPAASRVGPIRINLRTLQTDSGMRDFTIRGQILQSARDEFEFAQFTPTEVAGLPAAVTLGEPLTLTITGDLTVRDVTQPVTFQANVTPISEDRLEGLATATVLREDYGLTIPNVPGVADVTNEVQLEIEFVAQAVE